MIRHKRGDEVFGADQQISTIRLDAVCFRIDLGLSMQDIDGRNTKMNKYKGKVVLAVNVASQCGFTKQYQVRDLPSMFVKSILYHMQPCDPALCWCRNLVSCTQSTRKKAW